MGRYSALGWVVLLSIVVALQLLSQEGWGSCNLASSEFPLDSMPLLADTPQAETSPEVSGSIQQPGEPASVAGHSAKTGDPALPGNEEVLVATSRTQRQDTANPELVAKAKQVAQVNNQFAFDLFHQIAAERATFFSRPPASRRHLR